MWKSTALLLCLLVGGPAAAEEPLPPVLLTMTSGAVTAHFSGDKVGADITDLRYLDNIKLWFTFEGDKQTYAAHLGGQPHFGRWDFNHDIFSPDGRYVLLLHDHFGSYHIVDLENLKEYLEIEGRPDFEIPSVLPGNRGASDLSNARWTSSNSVEFISACCGGQHEWRFEFDRTAFALKCLRAQLEGGEPWKEC